MQTFYANPYTKKTIRILANGMVRGRLWNILWSTVILSTK